MLLGRSDAPERWPVLWGGIEQSLAGMPCTDAAWVVRLRRWCEEVTDAGLAHLVTIPGLQSLDLRRVVADAAGAVR